MQDQGRLYKQKLGMWRPHGHVDYDDQTATLDAIWCDVSMLQTINIRRLSTRDY